MSTGPAPTPVAAPGRLLRARRAAKGISQARLAAAIGCSPQYISLVEVGRTRPTPARLKAIIAVLDSIVAEPPRRRDPPASAVTTLTTVRACAICGTPLSGRARRRYCSRRCRVAAYRRRQGAPGIVRERRTTCRQCGRDLPQPSSRVYCSNACTHQAWAARQGVRIRPMRATCVVWTSPSPHQPDGSTAARGAAIAPADNGRTIGNPECSNAWQDVWSGHAGHMLTSLPTRW